MAKGYRRWAVAWLWVRVTECNLAELTNLLTEDIYNASISVVVSRSNRYISARQYKLNPKRGLGFGCRFCFLHL